MRIVCMSDTHELHRELVVPNGDMLIHAGDFTFFSKRPSMLHDFNRWLGELPHRYKVVVPGNHEYLLEDLRNRGAISNAILLIDAGVEIEGVKIWGSPGTPLYGGAFGMSNPEDRKKRWAQIPTDIEILISHGPAYGILDGPPGSEEREGDRELLEALKRVQPILHICGHVHAGYGTRKRGKTYHINAALLDESSGGVERDPIVVDFEVLQRRR
ncbi:MAG: metallophosphatase domain-containing protein [Terriglobia bacterium]|nr:metallophosphatase domain-containing protein [Terriglobia bacterium]